MSKRIGKPIWLAEWQKIHGSANKKLSDDLVHDIKNMYHVDKFTQTQIAEKFGVKQTSVYKFMKKHNILTRTLSEAKVISKATGVGLNKWREINGSWCKGLTKEDPKMAALIEKGRQTQIIGGKSKGKNNPMYGKLTRAKSGFRKDLGHYVRSSWEANFARICKYLKLNYEYEKHTFELSSGETYTPDFFILSKKRFYEIKGFDCNNKHRLFIKEFPEIKFSLICEKRYKKLIKFFGSYISIQDKDSIFTKEELNDQFGLYISSLDKRVSVRDFCKHIGISNKTIIALYGSQGSFLKLHYDLIKENDLNHIYEKLKKFKLENKTHPTRRQFYLYYSRATTIIKKYFNGKFNEFIKFS